VTFKRYDILLANLDPTQGSEMAKTRPVVVVSPDVMNAALETVVVCPLTTKLHPKWRSRVQVACAGKPAEIAVDQIRTISQFRLGRRVDSLKPAAAAEVRRLISELYGDG
jgi:mRNA interferase MazF